MEEEEQEGPWRGEGVPQGDSGLQQRWISNADSPPGAVRDGTWPCACLFGEVGLVKLLMVRTAVPWALSFPVFKLVASGSVKLRSSSPSLFLCSWR